MEKITIFTRGVSKGNPGPAAISFRLVDEKGKVLQETAEAIGNATEEYAEYFAVTKALQEAVELFSEKTKEINFELKLSDEVVKKQINSEETITHPGLVPYFIEIHNLRVSSFPNLTLTHVKLGLNKEADRLVNETLDA